MIGKELNPAASVLVAAQVNRRSFFRNSGLLGLGAATSGLLLPNALGQTAASQATEQAPW